MEINVGDYVRGFRGINKVIKIEPYNESYFYYTDGKNNNEGKPFYFERHITKHSEDIIDLIEVGDYVNGKNVHKIDIKENHIAWYLYDENNNMIAGKDSDGLQWKIKSILTKEQFEANAYTIEKER